MVDSRSPTGTLPHPQEEAVVPFPRPNSVLVPKLTPACGLQSSPSGLLPVPDSVAGSASNRERSLTDVFEAEM